MVCLLPFSNFGKCIYEGCQWHSNHLSPLPCMSSIWITLLDFWHALICSFSARESIFTFIDAEAFSSSPPPLRSYSVGTAAVLDHGCLSYCGQGYGWEILRIIDWVDYGVMIWKMANLCWFYSVWTIVLSTCLFDTHYIFCLPNARFNSSKFRDQISSCRE